MTLRQLGLLVRVDLGQYDPIKEEQELKILVLAKLIYLNPQSGDYFVTGPTSEKLGAILLLL